VGLVGRLREAARRLPTGIVAGVVVLGLAGVAGAVAVTTSGDGGSGGAATDPEARSAADHGVEFSEAPRRPFALGGPATTAPTVPAAIAPGAGSSGPGAGTGGGGGGSGGCVRPPGVMSCVNLPPPLDPMEPPYGEPVPEPPPLDVPIVTTTPPPTQLFPNPPTTVPPPPPSTTPTTVTP
jgi:hypothetical protein